MSFVTGGSDARDSIELGSQSQSQSHCSARDVLPAMLLILLLSSRPSESLHIAVLHRNRTHTCDVTGQVSRRRDLRCYEGRHCLKICVTPFLQTF